MSGEGSSEQPGPTAGAYIRSAEAALDAGHLGQSRALFATAAQVAEVAEDWSSLVTAALGIGGLWVYEQRNFVDRVELGQLWCRALEVAGDGSLAAARLRVRMAAEATYDGAPVSSVEQFVKDVEGFGDEAALAEALALLHHVHLGPSHAQDRLRLAEEIVRLASRAGRPRLGLVGLCWRTVDLYLSGHRAADQSLQEFRERAADHEAMAFIADVMSAMRLSRSGRLAQAEAAAASACDRGTAAGDPDAPAYFGALVATMRWWQGRGEEIIDQVRDLATSPRLGTNAHVYVAANAVLSAGAGELDAAEEAVTWLAASRSDSSSWLTTQFLTGEAAFALGNADVAHQVGSLLHPYADLPVMPSLAVACLGSTKRALGLAAATGGELDEAVEWLQGALEADRRLGNRPMAILTEHSLALVLGARCLDGDRDRSTALRARAEERARQIGLSLPPPPPWLVRTVPVRHAGSLSRVEGGWRVDVDGRITVVGDSVGMGYLAALVATPNRDRHVLELTVVEADHRREPVRGQPLLDRQALTSYRARARALREAVDLSQTVDKGSDQLRRELEAIRQTLRVSTEWDGSSRDFTTDQERARTAVRKAIVRAIRSISAREPRFGEHLSRTVATGTLCRYQTAHDWTVKVAEGPTVNV